MSLALTFPSWSSVVLAFSQRGRGAVITIIFGYLIVIGDLLLAPLDILFWLFSLVMVVVVFYALCHFGLNVLVDLTHFRLFEGTDNEVLDTPTII